MRYDSPDHGGSVLMRKGVVTVYSGSGRFSRFHRHDPALIGKTVHELWGHSVAPSGLTRIESKGNREFSSVIGATDTLDYLRTTGDVTVSSDGNEARLLISNPVEDDCDGPDRLESMPTLSSRPPIFVSDDAEWSRNSRLIAPWRDPEMLGQAILDAFRLVKPPFTPGLSSVFEREEPRRRTATSAPFRPDVAFCLRVWTAGTRPASRR